MSLSVQKNKSKAGSTHPKPSKSEKVVGRFGPRTSWPHCGVPRSHILSQVPAIVDFCSFQCREGVNLLCFIVCVFFSKASRPCPRCLDYSRQAVSQHFTAIFFVCFYKRRSSTFLSQPSDSTIQCSIPQDIFSEKLYKKKKRMKLCSVSSIANFP